MEAVAGKAKAKGEEGAAIAEAMRLAAVAAKAMEGGRQAKQRASAAARDAQAAAKRLKMFTLAFEASHSPQRGCFRRD